MKRKISKNFTLSEFVKTNTDLLNNPNEEQIMNLRILTAAILQPLRSLLNEEVIVTSGFRSKEVNTAVNGSEGSFHMSGMAADFKVKSFELAIEYINAYLEFTELGIYKTKKGVIKFIHVAYNPLNLSKETFIKIVK